MTRARRRTACIALALAALTALGGCAAPLERVAPYERGYFAQDKMSFAPIERRAEFEGHVGSIREGSRGGAGTLQGGCGCN